MRGDRKLNSEHHRQGQNGFSNGFFGKGPKGYQRSDERICDDVCDALYVDFRFDASDITVTVKDGIVYLRGEVSDRESKRAAEDCIENISGCEDIHNELSFQKKMGLNGPTKESDSFS